MKIINHELRAEFAAAGRCEICRRLCLEREGHHLWHRTPELTVRINLISLGSSPIFACGCHTKIGAGAIASHRVLAIVAAREKCQPEEIVEVMELFRRVVKPTRKQLETALAELTPAARALAVRELTEAGVMA